MRCCSINKKLLKGQSRSCLWWLQIKLQSSNQEEFDPFTHWQVFKLYRSQASTSFGNTDWNEETSDKAQPWIYKESHSSEYSPIAFSECSCTSISNRPMAKIYSFPDIKFWSQAFPIYVKFSKSYRCAKVTGFFREKNEDLRMICSWHVLLHLYHLNRFAGRVYLKQHLLLISHFSPLLWFQLPVCPSSLCSETMMGISAGYLKTEVLVN